MTLLALSYVGGVVTILSPCILPVLPFVFSGAAGPFRRNGLPLLAGMAATFVVVATLAVVGGGWVIHATQWGRWLALALLGVFAVSLLSPVVAERITRPFTRAGGALQPLPGIERGEGRSFIVGIATGLLWAPCAGPILGLILTGAALRGASVSTSLLLLSYALGASTSLAVALLAGRRVLRSLRGLLGAEAWLRRAAGALVLVGVIAIAMGWDRGVLTQLSQGSTDSFEQRLLAVTGGAVPAPAASHVTSSAGPLAALEEADGWINAAPLGPADLRGKVVLIDFWTYSCINCLRTLPYVKAWAAKYRDQGLVVIGVHTPEFAFEKIPANVAKAVRELGITYPVALDSRYAIWNAFHNQYWPAHYFLDSSGRIRHEHFGEGGYAESERVIQQLLTELNSRPASDGTVRVKGNGAEAAGSGASDESPETYLGFDRAAHEVGVPAVVPDQPQAYRLSARLALNEWSLGGRGRWVRSGPCSSGARGRLCSGFTPATCTWCWARGRGTRPCGTSCGSTGERRERPMAPTSTRPVEVGSKSTGSTSSFVSTTVGPSATGPSRSSSSILVLRPLPSRSAESGGYRWNACGER